ncbi:formate/nitrite transporter family protein [Evansella tamaricis]|uniref:Formate/nitrite transporter family protein n=1 Tax=Evansella tamaricis TaxID=2069301 RepID=A0ABS6JK13_9BACI|nr:formate/nitrite transporter family protein [Evansella tamaricis]MBU9713997.1 formate/nitrite transporter family protein [Evansella tamaricis]
MEVTPLLKVEELALKKQRVFMQSKYRYLLRAIIASMFIGFGVIVAFKTGNFFYAVGSPFTYPVAGITFGAAIILIAYGGGDLFTGNTFYFTLAALRKKMRWMMVIKLSVFSYLGNSIGAIVFAILIWTTGLFSNTSTNSFLITITEYKMTAPGMELFFRGILCNWLICLAFFIPMNLKEEGAKLFVMVILVLCFFISGYEHSIANMCTFAIALVLPHPETITLTGVIHNLVPVTVGNIIGGSVLMGYVYYYLNKPNFGEDVTEE